MISDGEIIEEWRAIEGWESLYEVSNIGRVRSIARMVAVGHGDLRLLGGSILKPVLKGRYYAVHLSDRRRKGDPTIHRLVAKAFVHGSGRVVRHLDGNSIRNVFTNLAWGSYADNEADRQRHGRVPRGEAICNSKLTDEMVRTIRSSPKSHFALAQEFNVAKFVIYCVRKRITWSHVI